MKRFLYLFIFLFSFSIMAQTTSHWGRVLRNSLDQPITGLTTVALYHYNGSLAYNLSEQGSTGYYYNDNVAVGIYDLYVGATKVQSGFWIGANILTLMADNLNSTGQLGTAGIQDGAITTGKIATGGVTGTNILDNTITDADLSETLINQIADAGYQPDNVRIVLNGSNQLTLGTTSITEGYLADGSVTTAKIENGTITDQDLNEESVTSSKIANANVTTAKIADLNVTTAKIADDAVTSTKLGIGAVDEDAIADNSITTSKIEDGGIAAIDLGTNSVTSAKILDGEVNTGDVADFAITGAKIFDGVVTSAKITDNTIVWDDLASSLQSTISTGGLTTGSVTTTHIADATILAEDIASDQITSNETSPTGFLNTSQFERIDELTPWQLKDAGIGWDKLSASAKDSAQAGSGGGTPDDNSVTSAKIVDGTIAAADLGTGSVTGTKILDATITSADLDETLQNAIADIGTPNDNSVTSAKIVDGTITGSDIGVFTITAGNVQLSTLQGAHIQDGSLAEADLAAAVTAKLNSSGRIANVVAYGADPSGSASSSQAFQDAIDAQIADSLPFTYIPQGIYKIQHVDVGNGMRIICDPRAIIKYGGTTPAGNTTSPSSLIKGSSTGAYIFGGIWIGGSGLSAMNFANSKNIVLDNVFIGAGSSGGIGFSIADSVTVRNCKFENVSSFLSFITVTNAVVSGNIGITTTGGSFFTAQTNCSDLKIENNISENGAVNISSFDYSSFDNNHIYNTTSSAGGIVIGSTVGNSTISGNYFYSIEGTNEIGISITGANMVFSDNKGSNVGQCKFWAENSSYVNNEFKDINISATRYIIDATHITPPYVFRGNTFLATSGRGIAGEFDGDGIAYVENNIISGTSSYFFESAANPTNTYLELNRNTFLGGIRYVEELNSVKLMGNYFGGSVSSGVPFDAVNNTFSGSDSTYSVKFASGSDNSNFINNIVKAAVANGLDVFSSNNLITNTTVVGTTTLGIDLNSGADSNLVNNSTFNITSGSITNDSGTSNTISGSTTKP